MKRVARHTVKFHRPIRNVSVRRKRTAKPVGSEAGKPPPPESQASQATASKELLQQIASDVQAFCDNKLTSRQQCQELAVEIGVAIAAHLTKKAIDANELQLQETVEAAIRQLQPSEVIRVELNPADALHFKETNLDGLSPTLQLAENATLPRGACFVSGDGIGLLSTLEARLGEIRETLLQGIDYARDEPRMAIDFNCP